MDPIYCQRDIPKERWRYGMRSSAAVGCGWIACFNALKLMGYEAKPESLIRYFERQLPFVHGNCGTSILGPAVLLKQMGFPVRVTARREEMDEAAKAADVSILFYRWKKGMKFGAHFVAVRYVDGKFMGYNTFRNSTGPDEYGESLQWFLLEKGYFTPVLIEIKKKKGCRIEVKE